MQLHRPLSVVTPTLDGDVLRVLAAAEATFTGREVARLLPEFSQKGVHNVLQRLVEQGIVLRDTAGPSHQYRLNREHLAAPYVVSLSHLRNELGERVAELIATWAIRPEAVILFGSAARDEMRPDSDIDLFVVRPSTVDDEELWLDRTNHLAERVSTWTGNDARILEMTPDEARGGLQRGDDVLLAIRDEGQALYGDPRYVQKLARAPRKGTA